MIFIPVIFLLVGLAIGLVLLPPLKGIAGTYLALACLAGLDSLLGGVRASLESKFHADVFVTGFLFNTIIAFSLGWLGDQIGLNLFLAAALVLGTRIFTNLSLIRRYALTRISDSMARRRLQRQEATKTE